MYRCKEVNILLFNQFHSAQSTAISGKRIDLSRTPATQLEDLKYIRHLYDHAPQPVVLLTSAGTLLYHNTFFQQHCESDPNFDIQQLHQLLQDGPSADVRIANKVYRFTSLLLGKDCLLSGTDITSVVAESDFYKECLDNLPADIGVFDLQGRYLYVNPKGIKDKELREWIIGKTDFDYCNYRGRDTAMAEFRKELIAQVAATNTEQGYEEEIQRPGTESDWQMRKLSPVFDDEGAIKFLLAYGINIKERKKAEIAQQEALQIVERSAKAKEEFVAVMSHEIRTPMNAIIGMSRLLAKTSLNQQQTEYLDAILTASGNLIVIVNDILDFSKIEAGKLRLEQAGFMIQEVFDYARAVTLQQANEKGLQLEFKADKELSHIFIGDIYRINQILVNLVNNAIKFTEHGVVSTNVTLQKDYTDRQDILVEVTDTGIGMTEDFMKEMFSMYSQEAGISRRYGGTGLGLKITSQLVDLMNGTIGVESRKNVGSCIRVQLSLPKGTMDDLPANIHLRYPDNVLKGKRIMVAEDNRLNVLLASTVLQNYGASVVVAENGHEAVKLLQKETGIDAVLMDVEMPVMDGLEATAYIRTHLSSTVPIIALTANVMPDDKERLAAAGMNEMITKPFAEADLIGALIRSLQ